jgi:hypothetical protein
MSYGFTEFFINNRYDDIAAIKSLDWQHKGFLQGNFMLGFEELKHLDSDECNEIRKTRDYVKRRNSPPIKTDINTFKLVLKDFGIQVKTIPSFPTLGALECYQQNLIRQVLSNYQEGSAV